MSSLYMHMPLSLPNKPLDRSCTFNGCGALKPPSPPRFVMSSSTATTRCSSEPSVVRRYANYKPPFWDYNYIQSLTTKYTEEIHSWRHAELIEQVKVLLQTEMEAVGRLELIDDLQRLGISYHFDNQIKQILNSIYKNKNNYINYEEEEEEEEEDLYSTALAFRLLRDYGFQVSQEVFDCFKNENGEFKLSLGDDAKGLLQLYEASFLLTEGEVTLEMAKEFATKNLQRKLDDEEMDENVSSACIRHALDLPIHWRVQRHNARWYIEAYERRRTTTTTTSQFNPILLHLAKLDFNILQSIHQEELKSISRWWKDSRLSEKLPFARDRVVECYLWALGMFLPPECGDSRMMATKANIFITIIDDIFDVYATLEELHLFNHAIQRWDVEAVEQLPSYMQICFLSLNNFINDIAYNVLKEQDVLIIQHLRKSWQDLCTAFVQEAEWQAAGHTPTVEEYINNGWMSSSGHVILSHAFFLNNINPIKKEAINNLYKYHDLVRYPSTIFRLTNDLATSPNETERGDVSSSVQCYMKEYGGSVEEGWEHVRLMIWETWKKVNRERLLAIQDYSNSHFSNLFIRNAFDLGRMAHYTYQLGDGHGIQNSRIKHRISSLLFQPIV